MYKLLLCWRYLKTRYLAFACIISVMLGVATLIVVNSVMSGFSTKLRDRLHGLLSDIVLEANSIEGFGDPDGKMAKIRQDPFLGPRVQAMTATMEVFAMLQYRYPNGEMVTRPVRLLGVEPKGRGAIGGFSEFLVDAENKKNPSFDIPADVKRRFAERDRIQHIVQMQEQRLSQPVLEDPGSEPTPPPPVGTPEIPHLPHGAIVGHLIAHFRVHDQEDHKKTHEVETVKPGDSIILTTVSGEKMTPVYDTFVVVDYFKSEMSEYDSNYIFVPLDYLQHLRTMQNRVTSIQIRLRDYGDAPEVVAALGKLFRDQPLRIETWEEKQGPLLRAIQIEKNILNVLLFLIIAVAGFGILAIFSMIVTEKTRDIGVLKALGAPRVGVLQIFLSYGLLLGLVGAGMGTALGLGLTYNLNGIEKLLTLLTGESIFSTDVYYFNAIPVDVQPWSIFMVNLGAVAIAVLFSILPALRAAGLHPVRALRYE